MEAIGKLPGNKTKKQTVFPPLTRSVNSFQHAYQALYTPQSRLISEYCQTVFRLSSFLWQYLFLFVISPLLITHLLLLTSFSFSSLFFLSYIMSRPVTVAARPKAWTAFARSNAGIVWVRIPLKAWMSVSVHSVCVVLYVGSGLATGWSSVKKSRRLCKRSRKLKKKERRSYIET
jgi:hypothetical protein